MTLSLFGMFADARAMWRSRRDMIGAIAGVFFVVPILGVLLLMAQSGLPDTPDPLKLNEAIKAFYDANLLPILLANLLIDFGTFAIFVLFLQGGDRSLGDVLVTTLRQLLPLIAVDVIAAVLFGIGLSLLILPGLFIFGRTWLIAPALAAAPERGMIAAFRAGWRQGGGVRWLILLGAGAATILAAVFVILVSSVVLGVVAAGLGDSKILEVAGYLLIAVIGGLTWAALALLRIAAYRLTASIGI